MWAVVAAHLSHNWGYYVMLMWLPTYLRERLGLDLKVLGLVSVLPYCVMYILSNASGSIADYWLRNDIPIRDVRIRIEAVAKLTPCLCFILLSVLVEVMGWRSQGLVLLLLCIGLGSSACVHSGYWCNIIDIAPRYTGMALGYSNSFASLPGIIGNMATGAILYQSGSWALVFIIVAGIYAAGFLVFYSFAEGHEVICHPPAAELPPEAIATSISIAMPENSEP